VGGSKVNLGLPRKKHAERTCFACRKVQDKRHLMRLVVDEQGVIWPDLSAKLPGRGAYLCLEEHCLKKMSDKRLRVLRRDFSPQLPQWDVLQMRMFDMLSQRLLQLLKGMKRGAVIGRDAVMHQMWEKKPLLVLLASDAGDALVRQIHDAVQKRTQREATPARGATIMTSLLDAQALGAVLGRKKISVVAFFEDNPLQKLQQICVWQQRLKAVACRR